MSRPDLCDAVTGAGKRLGRDTLCAWEAKGSVPGADWIPALSKALEVTPAYLLTGQEWEG